MLKRVVTSHGRLLAAGFCGIAVPLMLPGNGNLYQRGFIGWATGATLYLLLVWLMMLRSAENDIRRRARVEDESRLVILVLCAVAAMVSLAALPALLGQGAKLSEAAKLLRLGLGLYTIMVSWFFLHTIFTVHYAHEYYGAVAGATKSGGKPPPKQRGGLDFAGDEPFYNYLDFAYFAFTIGMTAQTSDTEVTTTRMRRLTLAHSIVTFFFNTGILALSINLVAGLLTGNG